MKSEFAFHDYMRQLIKNLDEELLIPTRNKVDEIKTNFISNNKHSEENYRKTLSDLKQKQVSETASLEQRRENKAKANAVRTAAVKGALMGIGSGLLTAIAAVFILEILGIFWKVIKEDVIAIPILVVVFLSTVAGFAFYKAKEEKEYFRYDRKEYSWFIDDIYTQNVKLIENQIDEARIKYENDVLGIRLKRDEELLELGRTIIDKAESLHILFSEFVSNIGLSGKNWDSKEWEKWQADVSPEFAARIGIFTIATQDLQENLPSIDWDFRIPALVPFSYNCGFLIEAGGSQKGLAIKALQSMSLRALAMTPPGKMIFTFIDPVGVGNNVASFMTLADFDKSLISGKAWSETRHIEQQLEALVEHIEDVIRVRLRDEFATISEYNKIAGIISEPFRCLVIFDFPINFSDTAVKRLTSIMRNGPRCGVYTVILRDSSKGLPYGLTESELDESAIRVFSLADVQIKDEILKPWSRSPEHFYWREQDFNKCVLRLDEAPEREMFQRIISIWGQSAKSAMKIEVPFEDLLKSASLDLESWWKKTSEKCLEIPLGPKTGTKSQYLVLNEGLTPHGIIVGRTGSGKTNLMHVIIMGLALAYSPEELELLLIDFKGGVGFKPYAEHRLPHASVIAIESEREFGISVLHGIDDKLKQRMDLFRSVGVDNLSAYRMKNTRPLPRILLIVDEFQEFFTENDKIYDEAKLIFDRILRQGRAFGIHVLLATQTLSGSAALPSHTIDQIAVRIALQCSDSDSRLILAHDNPAARTLTRPGEAIFNCDNGKVEGNYKFQVALFDDADQNKYLNNIDILADGMKKLFKPIVFEGNLPAILNECEPILNYFKKGLETSVPSSVKAWVGEPIAIRPPAWFSFSRQSGKHLLVVTRDEAEGTGILLSTWISLIAQYPPSSVEFFILDNSMADSAWAGMSNHFRDLFLCKIEIIQKRKFADVLKKFVQLINKRHESSGDNIPHIYLMIFGLQRVRDLREDEYGYSYSGKDEDVRTSDLMAIILKEGPDVGVHILALCDNRANAERALGRKIREFGVRIVGAMSSEDSSLLIDDLSASRINKPHRAILFDEDKPGALDILRPYAIPDIDFARRLASMQNQRR
jgi:DNA segregation ATPase FtsK/SpoIIIE, S-DNA-T family